MDLNIIYNESCLTGLKKIPDNSIDCVVTSPPYFGLRDYGNIAQIGLESSPELFVVKIVEVFSEVKRVLKNEGTLWLNIGDSYAGSMNGLQKTKNASWKKNSLNPTAKNDIADYEKKKLTKNLSNSILKPKDLIGIPWMVAFALRASGWYLRQDIIWHKPNPMPESVTDRCTKSHEYIFLFSKSQKYYYDSESIKTESKNPIADVRRITKTTNGKSSPTELNNGIRNPTVGGKKHKNLAYNGQKPNSLHRTRNEEGLEFYADKSNKRSVWTVSAKPFSEAHFATFPQDLIVDCIKAGCPLNGIVLDPFMGAGTTALVARKLNRNYIGFEINPDYLKISKKRFINELGMFI